MNSKQNIYILNARIPIFDSINLYDVYIKNGKIEWCKPQSEDFFINSTSDTVIVDCAKQHCELWPGFSESHSHLSLSTNMDNIIENPEIIKLQYLYFGITHVADLFGFPVIQSEWYSNTLRDSVTPLQITHCGYALTSPEADQKIGHGSEYPVPIHVVDSTDDIIKAIDTNIDLGATFLKVMYTSGIEKPGDSRRFSLHTSSVLDQIFKIAQTKNLECIIDCNTLDEVKFAARCGYRYFAHPVRDTILTAENWEELAGCHFMTTLQGLKPLTMNGREMLSIFDNEHFHHTQLSQQLDSFHSISVSYGVENNFQESRLYALKCMYENSIAALLRMQCLIGSDAGNTLSYHGFSYFQELLGLLNDERIDRNLLLNTATKKSFDFISRMSQKSHKEFLTPGSSANINLIPLDTVLPEKTIIGDFISTPIEIRNQITKIRTIKEI